MQKEYSIHWLEDIIKNILERNLSEITLATGKTPSGYIHLGILREIVICDAIRRKLEEHGRDVKFLLFFDSLDAAKRFPAYIDKNYAEENIGKPFSNMPCPVGELECESYADYFGTELSSTFKDFGIEVDVIWTHELYQDPRMKEKMRIALRNTEKVKAIIKKNILPTLDENSREIFLKMQEDWFPAMVICEKCNKLLKRFEDGSVIPNRVLSYDESKDLVTYSCSSCGYKGETTINNGNLKLNWRVDWPAKWAIFHTTCEPAGKDHSVKGGSYDTGLEISKEVFEYDGPIKLNYEWFRLGEQDMKTSKGIVFTPKKYLEMADPEVLRMLILKTNPNSHISFRIEELYQLYDSYEKMENIYFDLEEASSKEEEKIYKYMYPLCQIGPVLEKKPPRLSFKLITELAQYQKILKIEEIYDIANLSLKDQGYDEKIPLDKFKVQLKRAENWIREIKIFLDDQASEDIRKEILSKIEIFEIPDIVPREIIESLNATQKEGINILREFLESNRDLSDKQIQEKIYDISKNKLNLPRKKLFLIFQAIYLLILGKKSGPRLGHFLNKLDRDWVINRLTFE